MLRTLLICCLTALSTSASAQSSIEFRTIFWNMQSGNADTTTLAQQITAKGSVGVWGFSEVQSNADLATFEAAAEAGGSSNYEGILSLTGCSDKLGIVFNEDVVELLNAFELSDLNLGNACLRAPLVAHFKGRQTGLEFFYVVNHLARGNAQSRLEQAEGLVDWLGTHSIPTILGGDLNADFHIQLGDQGQRDAAYDELVADGPYVWVRPKTLVKTEDNDNFQTVLDFVLAGNIPMGWTATSTILEREGNFPATAIDFGDDATQTDHRPVEAVFQLTDIVDPCEQEDNCVVVERDEALDRIAILEAELAKLRALVEN